MFMINPFFNQQQADPNLTILLMHFDGTDGSTTFTDSSPHNHQILINGGTPTINTTDAKFSGAFTLVNTNSLKIDTASTLNIYNGDNYTIEFFIKINALPAGVRYLFLSNTTNDISYRIYISNLGDLTFSNKNSASVTTTALSLNTYHHIAFVRNGTGVGGLKVYVDGVLNATAPLANYDIDDTLATYSLINGWVIGFNLGLSTASLDEFRIRKEAVYTGNFTPPTAPFTY